MNCADGKGAVRPRSIVEVHKTPGQHGLSLQGIKEFTDGKSSRILDLKLSL